MVKITAFDWDNLYITPDEDPAYAGDKEPDSQDDIPCGEHYIPSDKDCHDGDAHDPAPGENPYWTDENSAEERNARDVDWDDNKPSEPAPEAPTAPGPSAAEESIDAVPEGQWARQKDKVAQALESLEGILARAPKGNTKANALKAAAKFLQSDDRNENLKAVEHLQSALIEARDFQNSPDSPPNVKGDSYRARVDKAQFAVDMFNSSIKPNDPRDIQVWDKISRNPETLEVEDLLQLVNFDQSEIPEFARDNAHRKVMETKELLEEWRGSPSLGGANLAKMFMDDPDAPMSHENMVRMKQGRQVEPEDPSPFETNTKLAMAILDRSARAGDEAANEMLWDTFGLSEEWTPTSHLYDYNKAAEKATKEMKTFADWSGIDTAQKAYMMAGSDWAEAESAAEEFDEEYTRRRAAIKKRRDTGEFKGAEGKEVYRKLVSDVEDDKDAVDQASRDAHMGVLKASDNVLKEGIKIRQPMKDAMRALNQHTQIDSQAAGEILSRAGNAVWAEIHDYDDDYTPANGEGIAGLSGKKLKALREKHRKMSNVDKNAWEDSSRYPNSAKIQETLQDFFSFAHGDIVGTPAMQNIQWESEVMVRAHANGQDGGSITLSIGADLKKIPKHEMYDTTRKDAEGEFSDREDIAIHEFAHHIEMTNPKIAQRFTDFFTQRTKGQPIVRAGDIDPTTGQPYAELKTYGPNEEFIPDHFFEAYCGRIYRIGEKREDSSSELVSMGMQAFYNDYQWGAMVRDDPEHMALIIATLRGY